MRFAPGSKRSVRKKILTVSASAAARPARPRAPNKLVKKFEEEAAAKGVDLEIVKTGCQGFCQRGPVMIQEPQETFYQKVKVADIPELFSGSVLNGVPYRKQLYREVPLVRAERRDAGHPVL